MTKREEIMQALGTLLTGTTGLAVFRSRVNAFLRGETGNDIPVHYTWTRDNVLRSEFPNIDWALSFKISFLGRGPGPDSLVDDAVEAVYEAVMNSAELNGLCIDIQPAAADLTSVQADNDAGVVSCDFIATYRTSMQDIGT